jgi:hypothetical protein
MDSIANDIIVLSFHQKLEKAWHGGEGLVLTHIINKLGHHQVVWRSKNQPHEDEIKSHRQVSAGDKVTHNGEEHTITGVKYDGYLQLKDKNGKRHDKSPLKVEFHQPEDFHDTKLGNNFTYVLTAEDGSTNTLKFKVGKDKINIESTKREAGPLKIVRPVNTTHDISKYKEIIEKLHKNNGVLTHVDGSEVNKQIPEEKSEVEQIQDEITKYENLSKKYHEDARKLKESGGNQKQVDQFHSMGNKYNQKATELQMNDLRRAKSKQEDNLKQKEESKPLEDKLASEKLQKYRENMKNWSKNKNIWSNKIKENESEIEKLTSEIENHKEEFISPQGKNYTHNFMSTNRDENFEHNGEVDYKIESKKNKIANLKNENKSLLDAIETGELKHTEPVEFNYQKTSGRLD